MMTGKSCGLEGRKMNVGTNVYAQSKQGKTKISSLHLFLQPPHYLNILKSIRKHTMRQKQLGDTAQ